MNLIAYIAYFFITYFITVHVGLQFYKNGRIYILELMQGDEKITDAINKLLLVGYYLLNIGYLAITLHGWKRINTLKELVDAISVRTGTIMLTLACIHFCNMAIIAWLKHKHVNKPIKT
jgi:hypothetical protein